MVVSPLVGSPSNVCANQGTWKEARKLGLAEGEAKGEARALLTVLRGRRIAVPDVARDRILAERDPVRPERAAVAEVIDELS